MERPFVFSLEYNFYDLDDCPENNNPITVPYITVYPSRDLAIKNIEGINFLEGDIWAFLGDGRPLKPVFIKEPYIHTDKLKYFPGEYTLELNEGEPLQEIVSKFLSRMKLNERRIVVHLFENKTDVKEKIQSIFSTEILKHVAFE